jgi:membrane protease YdiL (CAAX protease family)
MVGSQQGRTESWQELLGVGAGATLPADLVYRSGEALTQFCSAPIVEHAAWWLTQSALAMYERLAYGPSPASAEARLRVAIAYGKAGHEKEAANMLAPVPIQAPALTRVSVLLDWLYGTGQPPADLGLAMADLEMLDPWLVRKCQLRLAEKQADEAAARRVAEAEKRASFVFLACAVAQALVWVALVVLGTGAALIWFLRWLFGRRYPVRVHPAPLVRPWHAKDALEIWGVLLFLVVVVKVAGVLVVGKSEQTPFFAALVDAVGYLLAAGGAIALMMHKLARQPVSMAHLLGMRGPIPAGVGRGVVAYGVLGAGLLTLGAVLTYVFGTPVYLGVFALAEDPVRFGLRQPGPAVVYAVIAVLVAPLVEETLFRGFIYPGLRRRFGVLSAIVASALMFAITHLGLPPVALMGIAMLAVAFAVAYEQTRNLWVSVGMHVTHNALVFALLALTAV